MTRRISAVRKFLRASPAAAHCLDRNARSDQLLEQVRALLHPDARPHCVGVTCTEQSLTLTFDTSAWATRVRFETEALAGAFKHAYGGDLLRSVNLRVQPGHPAGLRWARPLPSRPRLSRATVEHLFAAAEHLDDPELREVFKRFAERHAGGITPPADDD